MNFAAAMLAPISLLVAAIGGDRQADGAMISADNADDGIEAGAQDAPQWPIGIIRSFQPDSAWQVHIEQRMIIRIAPRAMMPLQRDMFVPSPRQSVQSRLVERKIGKCVPAADILGVQPNGPAGLVLFMRDRRMISAELERSCRSRAFYSGFYLSRNTDGKVCVDRDTLLSRSGSACKLSRIRQLVEDDD